MAPGTVGMHCKMSYMRRSRLKPITYSRCCQRPSRPRRLATLVLPETAPTMDLRGCREGSHQRSYRVILEDCVSRQRESGCRAWPSRMPVLNAAGFPAFALPEDSHLVVGQAGRRLCRTVARAVVYDHNVEIWITVRNQRPYGRRNSHFLVVRGYPPPIRAASLFARRAGATKGGARSWRRASRTSSTIRTQRVPANTTSATLSTLTISSDTRTIPLD